MFETVGSPQGMLADLTAQLAVVLVLLVASVCAAGATVETAFTIATLPVEVEVVQAPREVTWAAHNRDRER